MAAIERMRINFQRPSAAMGEAWFMGDRRMFSELLEQPISEAPVELLEECLEEISSGIRCFGHLQEWHEWFKYLLPDLILRGNQTYAFHALIESTVTAFMNVFWTGIAEEYVGFGADVRASLAYCLMEPEVWIESSSNRLNVPRSYPLFLVCENEEGSLEPAYWDAGETSNQLSCMMFFCLKYLPIGQIPTWVSSVMAIENPYWKGAFMVWLLGVQDLLEDKVPVPSKLKKTNPKVSWYDSHALGSRFGSIDAEEPPCDEFNDNKDFLSFQSNAVFLAEIKCQLTPEALLQWTDSIATEPHLNDTLQNTADLLFDKLMRERGNS